MSSMSNITESTGIPEWVRWLAKDSDGSWRGYSVEPLRNDNGWYENEVGRYVRLGVDDLKGWDKSLTAVTKDAAEGEKKYIVEGKRKSGNKN